MRSHSLIEMEPRPEPPQEEDVKPLIEATNELRFKFAQELIKLARGRIRIHLVQQNVTFMEGVKK